MVTQVCCLQARGVCAAILSSNTVTFLGVSKAVLASEKDAQGMLFTPPEAIAGDSRQKQMVFELRL